MPRRICKRHVKEKNSLLINKNEVKFYINNDYKSWKEGDVNE